MKSYKLQLAVRLVEVEQFNPPLAGERHIDPVERDREEIGVGAAVALLQKMQEGPKARAAQVEISLKQTYDVPAEDLAAAAAKLKHFEEAAERIGAKAETAIPADLIAPSYPAVWGGRV